MAKRFTESTKWKKLWIRKLNPKYKLFWFYLLDNCDHAGIYDADIESASFHIGIEYNKEEILETFNRKIVPFKKDKWFIPKFVEYQYGELNENNRAHLSVINILSKYKLLGSKKALNSPLEGSKDKIQSKVKDLVVQTHPRHCSTFGKVKPYFALTTCCTCSTFTCLYTCSNNFFEPRRNSPAPWFMKCADSPLWS